MAIAFFYIWTVFYSLSWNGTPWVSGDKIESYCLIAVANDHSASSSAGCQLGSFPWCRSSGNAMRRSDLELVL